MKIRVVEGPSAAQDTELEGTRIRVGRGAAADVRINHESVSGLHFELRIRRNRIELLDLGSHNGTTLLGRRVFHAEVQLGDTIGAGACTVQIVDAAEIEVEHSEETLEDGLLGISPVMQEVFALIGKVAPRQISVLISGESGTGKDLVARALHRRSPRSEGPLVVLDCGALALTLAESALFGHRKGAFTGADADTTGVFEDAAGGTVFIDEIGELPLSLQAKLLRALEAREVIRLGETRARPIDVRVLAATHRDLRSMVDAGTFREDLYYRIARFTIDLPPLRERGTEDIEHLARAILRQLVETEGLPLRFEDHAMQTLTRHHWPGNVRELSNAIERASVRCNNGAIGPKDFRLRPYAPRSFHIDEAIARGSYDGAHRELDRWLIPQILDEVGGNVSEAARRFGVGRKKLMSRIEGMGIIGHPESH